MLCIVCIVMTYLPQHSSFVDNVVEKVRGLLRDRIVLLVPPGSLRAK